VGATFGADKGYDTQDFVAALKQHDIKAHIVRYTKGRHGASDGHVARDKDYTVSRQIRKRIGPGCGWVKTVSRLCRPSMWCCLKYAAG
jgi:hypothetical protein